MKVTIIFNKKEADVVHRLFSRHMPEVELENEQFSNSVVSGYVKVDTNADEALVFDGKFTEEFVDVLERFIDKVVAIFRSHSVS